MRSWSTTAVLAVAVAGLLGGPAAAGWAAPPPSGHGLSTRQVSAQTVVGLRSRLRAGTLAGSTGVSDICAEHHLACRAEVLTAAKRSKQLLVTGQPLGYGAKELERAYGLSGAGGTAGTIAVIEAGAYPTLESDLTIYRDAYGLPRCTSASGCFKQVRYTGGAPYAPSLDPDTAFIEEIVSLETALDVDMASAACPRCKILEVQVPALDAAPQDQAAEDVAALHFAKASQEAVRLHAGAVSISYGYDEDATMDRGTPAADISHRGVAVVASSGDDSLNLGGNIWPADLTTVIAAGGTSLYADPAVSRKYAETAWNGAGSGCTADLGPAVGQPAAVAKACYGSRADSDVSAVADPYTGVAVYNSYAPATGYPYGFVVVGGTSVSAPFLAGMYARHGVPSTVLGPNALYRGTDARFHDVVLGANEPLGECAELGFADDRLCTAGVGWDGPTGRGTPRNLATFD